MIIIRVTIQYRDDTVEDYACTDAPFIADWVTLYLMGGDMRRKVVPREAMKSIEYWHEEEENPKRRKEDTKLI